MERIVSITQQLINDLREANRDEDTAYHSKPARANILIVEDNLEDAEIQQNAVKKMGASSTLARSGAEALQVLEQTRHDASIQFQIIFLDLNLQPGPSGYEVLNYIRTNFPKAHVVIVSGHVDTDVIHGLTRRAGQDGGYFGIIEKPLSRNNVMEIFEKHNLGGA